MNMNHTRITVTLSKSEWDALRLCANSEYRNPRDQARYLLRNALGVKDSEEVPGQSSPTADQHQPCGHTLLTG